MSKFKNWADFELGFKSRYILKKIGSNQELRRLTALNSRKIKLYKKFCVGENMYNALKISKILVGTDGSEYSLRILEFSKNLARKYNSQIIAFTAFNIPDMYKISEKEEEDYNTNSIEKEIRKSKRLLSSISKKAIEEGINLKTKFYDAKLTPDLAMIEYSESEGVNHIVIGFRGRSLENLLMGNIATSIVKLSKCSVTIIK